MKDVYLIKVEASANNNKFYRMSVNDDGRTFTTTYGRVGATSPASKIYDTSEWDKKYHEKIRKGYVDKTELRVVESKTEYVELEDTEINRVVKRIMEYAKQKIESSYTISSENVSRLMIDKAQGILDELSTIKDVQRFNRLLGELFLVIPRKMKNVSENLCAKPADMRDILFREQDLLDVMKGQVVSDNVSVSSKSVSILDAMGLSFSKTSKDDVEFITTIMGGISGNYNDSWVVENKKTRKDFTKFIKDNNVKNIKTLWHGSRNENWWNIIGSGLLINPPAKVTGKMFGHGIYFAPKARKSLGYTSLSGSYWAGGNSNRGFMSIYEVAYGTPYDVYDAVSDMTWDKLQRVSFGKATSLHAHEGRVLRNDEIVVYKQEQTTIKYLVELKG